MFTDGTVNNNDGDRLVDDLFYYSQNHDVWNAHADADTHYHSIGWQEGRDPNAFFSTTIYLSANPDAKAGGVDPLTQFDQRGWKTGTRAVAQLRSGRVPRRPIRTSKRRDIDPLQHFLQRGIRKGRQPVAPTELIAPNGFDYVYYLQQQSRRGGGRCRSAPAFPDRRLEGRAQSERAVRHQRLSCDLHRRESRGRKSARPLRYGSAGRKAAIPRSTSTQSNISRPMPT